MKEVVASGRTVEDAKREALKELGVDSEELVEIEVIDEGSKGVFGWGTKFARIKVKLVAEPEKEKKEEKKWEKVEKKREEAEKKERVSHEFKKRKEELKKTELHKKEAEEAEKKERKKTRKSTIERAEMPPITVGERPLPSKLVAKGEKKEIPQKEPEKPAEVELLEEEEAGPYNPRKILRTIIDYMNIDAEIIGKKTSEGPLYDVEGKGKDVGVLIGKHGQTLEAVQFIINLILLRRTKKREKITIDVEGYRARREKSLRNLARKLAEKAEREKRNVVLEPMLPSERRIIHVTLQNNPNVTTFSRGDEPMRKVIISPKRKK